MTTRVTPLDCCATARSWETVTIERASDPGCRLESLGVMRYVPVTSPGYIERYLDDGLSAETVAEAPSLSWNRDDALRRMLLRKEFRRFISRPVHYVPTAEGFGAVVPSLLGMGDVPGATGGAGTDVCIRGTDTMRRGRPSAGLLHWALADQAMPYSLILR